MPKLAFVRAKYGTTVWLFAALFRSHVTICTGSAALHMKILMVEKELAA